jgi:hypothetical protein
MVFLDREHLIAARSGDFDTKSTRKPDYRNDFDRYRPDTKKT